MNALQVPSPHISAPKLPIEHKHSQGNNGSRVTLVVSLSVVLPVAAVAAALIAWYIWRGGSSSGGQRSGLFRTASGKKRSRAPEVSSDTTLVVSVEEGDGKCGEGSIFNSTFMHAFPFNLSATHNVPSDWSPSADSLPILQHTDLEGSTSLW